MGSGASGECAKQVGSSSAEDLAQAVQSLPADARAKLSEALALMTSEPAEPPIELSYVLEELFKCFDADQDGQIEREEYLACWEKISELLDESFGPKQRKQKMTWFKDAGAEGSPGDGMYLSREKFQEAYVKTASSESEIAASEEPKLAAWIWRTSYGQRLAALCFPSVHAGPSTAKEQSSGRPLPQYPVTIPLNKLAEKLDEAKDFNLRPLIFASHVEAVDTYLKYRIDDSRTFDASKLFLMSAKQKKELMQLGMEHGGVCYPLYMKLGAGESDITKSCCDEMPAEVFDGTVWTPQAAFQQDFISQALVSKLENDPSIWKLFTIILHSELGLEEGKAKLADKIPYFEKLAIIAIDPSSVD